MRNECLNQLPSCHHVGHCFYLLAVLFGQISSAVCDFNTKVEPDNWGVKIGVVQETTSWVSYSFISDQSLISGNGLVFITQSPVWKKKINCIFVNCFRIFHIPHYWWKKFAKKKYQFWWFSPLDHDVSIFYKVHHQSYAGDWCSFRTGE